MDFRLKFIVFQFYKRKKQPVEYTVEIIDDIEENGYCFTDGCGLISRDLAKSVAEKIGIRIEDDVNSLHL